MFVVRALCRMQKIDGSLPPILRDGFVFEIVDTLTCNISEFSGFIAVECKGGESVDPCNIEKPKHDRNRSPNQHQQ